MTLSARNVKADLLDEELSVPIVAAKLCQFLIVSMHKKE